MSPFLDWRSALLPESAPGRCRAVLDCDRPTASRQGLICEMHYGRFRRNGHFDRLMRQATGNCAHCGVSSVTLHCSSRCAARTRRSAGDGMRVCRVCDGEVLGRADLVACSPKCRKVVSRCNKFGITIEQFRSMFDEQGGRCAACRDLPSTYFHIDHHHESGRVRGILCDRCNPALGKLRDDPARAERLAAYLTREPPALMAFDPPSKFGRGDRICRWCATPFERASARARYCATSCTDKGTRIIKVYGLHPEQYRDLLARQGGACASCEEPSADMHIDHCHASGVVRGILCGACNLAAGLVLDSPERALALRDYLLVA